MQPAHTECVMTSIATLPAELERQHPLPLCLANGHLNPAAIGWSRRPITHCNLPERLGRRKRWNDWRLLTPDWMLAITLADLDYIGFANVHFIDLHNGRQLVRTVRSLFSRGISLPDEPRQAIRFQHHDLYLEANETDTALELIIRSTDLIDSPLSGRFVIQHPRHLDSINLVVPLGGLAFNCASRQVGLPLQGSLSLGSQHFQSSHSLSFAALDFSRGIWPYRSHWLRAAFAGPGGVAANFGSGWTDGSGLNENAIWLGGQMHKLAETIHFKPDSQRPGYWHLHDDYGRVQLHFTYLQEQRNEESMLCLKMYRQLAYGRFDGMLIGENGERVKIDGLMGWIGKNTARW